MEIWRECKVTGKKFQTCRAFLNNLRITGMTSKEYYDLFHKSEDEGKCKVCSMETKYSSFSYKTYCSAYCHTQDVDFKKRMSDKFVINPKALESFRSKYQENPWDNNIAKRNETIFAKCVELDISRDEYFSNHSKNAFESRSEEDIQKAVEKAMKTKEKIGNHGGRSGYKPFDFLGETVTLQGYEPIVVNYLIDTGFDQSNLKIGKINIPMIKYHDNNKFRNYFPDLFLPDHNLLIEVKSGWTFSKNREITLAKAKASIESGYSILVLVLTKSEGRNAKLEGSKKMLDWAISSQASNPENTIWYGEGSTTILNGVESSDSKCSTTING